MSTCSPTGMRSVGSRCATGCELDEAPGDVSSASRSTCTIPLSLAVAFVAVRFPPALDDEVATWWDSSHFLASDNEGFCSLALAHFVVSRRSHRL